MFIEPSIDLVSILFDLILANILGVPRDQRGREGEREREREREREFARSLLASQVSSQLPTNEFG